MKLTCRPAVLSTLLIRATICWLWLSAKVFDPTVICCISPHCEWSYLCATSICSLYLADHYILALSAELLYCSSSLSVYKCYVHVWINRCDLRVYSLRWSVSISTDWRRLFVALIAEPFQQLLLSPYSHVLWHWRQLSIPHVIGE